MKTHTNFSREIPLHVGLIPFKRHRLNFMENIWEKYKNLPILNTKSEFVYDNLIKLIENKELRLELGIIEKKYIEDVHESKKIATKLIELYSN